MYHADSASYQLTKRKTLQLQAHTHVQYILPRKKYIGPQKGPTETAVVPEGPVKKKKCYVSFLGEGRSPRMNPDSPKFWILMVILLLRLLLLLSCIYILSYAYYCDSCLIKVVCLQLLLLLLWGEGGGFWTAEPPMASLSLRPLTGSPNIDLNRLDREPPTLIWEKILQGFLNGLSRCRVLRL